VWTASIQIRRTGSSIREAARDGLTAWRAARPFATLPDWAIGLAATDDQVFTLDVFGDRLWGLDRVRGRVLRTIPTGRSPLGLVLAAD
jgi:hypothetical protein